MIHDLKSLELHMSRICGQRIEITIRGFRQFTFSFEGDHPEAVQRMRDYLEGYLESALSEYDRECDYTVLYITIREARITPVETNPEQRNGNHMSEKIPEIPDHIVDRAIELLEADSIDGICLSCEAEQYGVEPDARNYHCESCHRYDVFGADEIVLMGGLRG